ncbi:MAG: hypothetical protein M3P95_07100 [Actinomycetota bacterium]|jgi:hypothetical protein|nr:hypothetical protein [Actinomycetota bacterium]
MTNRNTFVRSLHDLGLGAWFGGSLMGAIGLNGAAADVDDPTQRARVANAGWDKWTPVNALAIGVHLIGGIGILRGNSHRIAGQKGVAGATVLKAGLTGAALVATAASRAAGQKVISAGDVPVAGGTDPLPSTPPDVAKAQKQLKVLQWVIPALTGAIMVMNSYQGEQQRGDQELKGVVGRIGQGTVGGLLGAGKLAS